MKKPKEHKKLTLDEYHAMKTQGKTDKDVRNHLGWSGTKLHEWKKKHGLVKPHKEDKPKVKPKKDSVPDDYQKLKEQFDLMSEKYQSLNDMYHGAESAVEILTEELQEVKTKLGYALQWEDRYNQLKEQIEKSLEWEKEYRKLEIDYRNEVTETKRLKDMLSNLKHTEVMNVMLMEQRVLLQRQLDEVTI